MGKEKYTNKANNQDKDVPNYVPYKDFSKFINEIDIGDVRNFNLTFTSGVEDIEELGEGMFRNSETYELRIAGYYIASSLLDHDLP